MAKAKDTKELLKKDAVAASATSRKKSGSKPINWQLSVMVISFMGCCLAFLPTTVMIFFGLMPTFAALVLDPTPDRIKTMTVGAMNLAGVIPFLLKLWITDNGQSMEYAFNLIGQPMTLITMYGVAALGYVIFYTVSGLLSSLLLKQGKDRYEEVKKRMAELERKWGQGVSGVDDPYRFDEDDMEGGAMLESEEFK